MGVYIKGMRMPKNGFQCELQAWDNSCNAFPLDETIICDNPNHRHPNCPLVEVAAPHGRLIDADELINKHFNRWTCYDTGRIGTAPTIIEAEREE